MSQRENAIVDEETPVGYRNLECDGARATAILFEGCYEDDRFAQRYGYSAHR
jgi:hypothetical protein